MRFNFLASFLYCRKYFIFSQENKREKKEIAKTNSSSYIFCLCEINRTTIELSDTDGLINTLRELVYFFLPINYFIYKTKFIENS